MKMREKWSKSIAVTQREAKERAKFNDAQPKRYIHKRESLSAFASTIHHYDNHIKLHPPISEYIPAYCGPSEYNTMGYRGPTEYNTMGHRRPSVASIYHGPSVTSTYHGPSVASEYNMIGNRPPNKSPPISMTTIGTTSCMTTTTGMTSSMTMTEKTREQEGSPEYNQRAELHIKSIAERKSPATNKYTWSFLYADGIPNFIERPCEFCKRRLNNHCYCRIRKMLKGFAFEDIKPPSQVIPLNQTELHYGVKGKEAKKK